MCLLRIAGVPSPPRAAGLRVLQECGMTADNAAAAIAAVTGYEPVEPRGVRERYAEWASGRRDEGMAFIVAGASNGASDPVAYPLFDLHVLEFGACGFGPKA